MLSPPIVPGSVAVVRDEEWLVTSLEQTADGQLVQVQGLSELVSGTTAAFYDRLDTIEVQDPAEAQLVADSSPRYRRARVWLEGTIRKTPVPLSDTRLTVTAGALADALAYQRSAVTQALSPDNLRPRILLADAVGLGKTLEIGMILAELARRGRADRVLIVCPRHVLEQMQHELWTRFALPFVRLDSIGVQRVRQELPSTRNPFTYFKRVIISIDTLKQDRFTNDLRRHHWDAVVIDESHNVTNSATQNNKLARVLAPNTDALILASATPHNGRAESFAELIRLLEPTAVAPDGSLVTTEVQRLVVRRHRHSPEVAQVVGDDWAERREPQNFLVEASPAENAVADELDAVWLHPSGRSAYSGSTSTLFPWTLAKAFLSSPAALAKTISERRSRLGAAPDADTERAALDRLEQLNQPCLSERAGKYGRLLDYLRQIGVGPRSPMRAVIFAERVQTLDWLRLRLSDDLGLPAAAVAVLNGTLTDEKQQEVVESFKLAASPIRLLITGDIASEGVNLHRQCHQLIHFDIPWSLIRIEQRNGRIDRYGQRHRPQITTLLLRPSSPRFAGDLRVLRRLLEREQVAHSTLGDAAGLMVKYSVRAEEDELARVLAGQLNFDDVVAKPDAIGELDPIAAFLAGLEPTSAAESASSVSDDDSLYRHHVDFLRDALLEIYETPDADQRAGGVRWREHLDHGVVSLEPPPDLRQRLRALPAEYRQQRHVDTRLTLAVTELRGNQSLADALTEMTATTGTSWPEAHFLAPLHPVLDWVADRSLNTLNRHQVYVVRGSVDHPTVLLLGTLTNRRGQVVASSVLTVEFPNPDNPGFAPVSVHGSVAEAVAATGFDPGRHNPGPVGGLAQLQPLIRAAVETGDREIDVLMTAARDQVDRRLSTWQDQTAEWTSASDQLTQTLAIKQRRGGVAAEQELIRRLAPDRSLVRPLIVVVPADHPVAVSP